MLLRRHKAQAEQVTTEAPKVAVNAPQSVTEVSEDKPAKKPRKK